MPITVTGWERDFRPFIRCRIAPAAVTGVVAEPIELVALIDTGATYCQIRADTQERLGLPVLDAIHTVNIGSAATMPVTRIDVLLDGTNDLGEPQSFTAMGARTFITRFDGNMDLILGMNVLRLLAELRVVGGVPTLVTPS